MLAGEVSRGQEWSAPIGEDWRFRLVPIPDLGHGYSGWDLVVDREQGRDTGYPDALLVATPPYGSLNEREVGTTFGLRAQDAIAWTPRHFRFLTSSRDLARARELFRTLTGADENSIPEKDKLKLSASETELLRLISGAATGQFTMQDARLVAGTGDAAPFAVSWAARLSQISHTLVQPKTAVSGFSAERGELQWIHFSATLWLPQGWRTPPELHAMLGKCTQ